MPRTAKYISVNAEKILGEKQMILLANDITRIKELENEHIKLKTTFFS